MSNNEYVEGADFSHTDGLLTTATYDDVADAPDLTDPFDTAALAEARTKCEFLTGRAGTGKTFQCRERFAQPETKGILSATTGIAAVNLGAVTINSLLGYFNSESLQDKFVTGALARKIHSLAKDGVRVVGIDEISMMASWDLDVIYQGFQAANQRLAANKQIALLLTGDFCQLPPIPPKGTREIPWAFKSDAWPEFAAGMTKLEKVWRQSDVDFLTALNAARGGDGKTCAAVLRDKAKFVMNLSNEFEGTTILPKNDLVDNYNKLRYLRVVGKEKSFASRRWGKLGKEADNVPATLKLKVGAYVMILANKTEGGEIVYANGDVGYVREFTVRGTALIELARTGTSVEVDEITRQTTQKDEPQGTYGESKYKRTPDQAYWDAERKCYVTGAVTYLPLRYAWATTVHKSQGLTLTGPVQIDFRNAFFGFPAMAYVSISRSTRAENLRIVGTPELLQARVKVDKEVLPWI